MEIQKPGKYLEVYEVTPALSERILKRICQAEAKKALIESFLSYSFVVLASFLCFGAFWWIYQDATQTGLWTSLSLIFTDGSTVMSYWKEFSMSIIESLPFISLVSVFISLLVLVLATGNLSVVRQNRLRTC
jgi:hypothetical protein